MRRTDERDLTRMVSVKMSPSMHEWLRALAYYEHKSVGQVIREFLEHVKPMGATLTDKGLMDLDSLYAHQGERA